MLGYIKIVYIYLKNNLYSVSRQGDACADKINAGKTPLNVNPGRVLATYGFSEMSFTDCAVLVNFGFLKNFTFFFSQKFNLWTIASLEMEIFESQKICLTLRSVSQCRV